MTVYQDLKDCVMGKLKDLDDYVPPQLAEIAAILGHLRALAESTSDDKTRNALATQAAEFMAHMNSPSLIVEDVELTDFTEWPGGMKVSN